MVSKILRKYLHFAVAIMVIAGAAPHVTHGELALVVANIRVTALDDRSAVVEWSTNMAATGRVEYGQSVSYGSTVGYQGEQRTSHRVTLFGLKAETTYHFRAVSSTAGQEASSFDQTFKTTKAVDREVPAITDVAIPYQGGTLVVIQWRTSEAATSQVFYGLTSRYGQQKNDGVRVAVHEVILTNLAPLTTYHFQARSTDKDGNVAISDNHVVRTTSDTTARPPLELTAIRPVSTNDAGVTDTAVEISWRSSTLATGVVRWGPTDKLGRTITLPSPRDFAHRTTVSGLKPNATYYFQVESKDIFNATVRSAVMSVVTRSVAEAAAAGDGQALADGPRYDLMFYASYNQGFAADFALGDPLGIPLGVPSLTEDEGGRRQAGVALAGTNRLQYDGRGNTAPGEGTVAFWFKPHWNSDDGLHHLLFMNDTDYAKTLDKYFIIGKTGTKGIADQQPAEGNKLYFGLEDTADVDQRYFVQNVTLKAGQWYFIAVTWRYDGGVGKVYVNGEPAQTNAYIGLTRKAAPLGHAPANLFTAFTVGGNRNEIFKAVDGDLTLDELTIFGRALDDNEIKLLSTEGVGRWLPAITTPSVSTTPIPARGGQVLGSSTLQYTPATALLRAEGEPDVYAILNGHKHLISGPSSFAAYGYRWSDVRQVSPAIVDRYPNARLVRTPTDDQIFYLYQRPQKLWLKLGIPSPTVFVSYPENLWGNVVTINEIDMASYPPVRLVKADDDPAVYLLDDSAKRLIATDAVFDALSLPRSHVATVSRTHADFYPIGEPIR